MLQQIGCGSCFLLTLFISQKIKLLLGILKESLYYEKIGLIPKSKPSIGNFRLYPESLIPCFYFIQNAKLVGFDLNEIKCLLDIETNQYPVSR